MERKIPSDLHKSIVMPLIGYKGEETKENYVKRIEKFERRVEKALIDLLKLIDIDASTKTVPSSLPYKEELVYTLMGESWMNGPYEFKRVFKMLLKDLLDKKLYKFRFYFQINIITDFPNDDIWGSFGKIEYRFRYY